MGVWNTALDSAEKAHLFVDRMSSPWLLEIDKAELLSAPDSYALVGCDGFFDVIDQHYKPGDDIRIAAFEQMYKWVFRELDTFVEYDEVAVAILKKGLLEMADQNPSWMLGELSEE